MSQGQFAEFVGSTQSQISSYESCRRTPTQRTVDMMHNALGIRPGDSGYFQL